MMNNEGMRYVARKIVETISPKYDNLYPEDFDLLFEAVLHRLTRILEAKYYQDYGDYYD